MSPCTEKPRSYFSRYLLAIVILALVAPSSIAQTSRSPSDVVREFYKAMHERRFKDAWALTVYKPAVEGLSAEEMEDLRPFFEGQAAPVPEQIQIDNEQVSGATAKVFIQLPATDSSPQVTSKPVDLIYSSGVWIIGTEAEQATVKKTGHRYFLDAVIDLNQDNMEDVLKRLIGVEAIYAQTHNGVFGGVKDLIGAGLMSDDMVDAKTSGYNFHLTVAKDGKTFVASAEPARYGHTAKLSFWMDQTGSVKKLDNAGKPFTAPK
jgi:hypothetical protein